jgi:hypothetical protein
MLLLVPQVLSMQNLEQKFFPIAFCVMPEVITILLARVVANHAELLLLHAREQELVVALEPSEFSRWLTLLAAARVDMIRKITRVKAEAERAALGPVHLWYSTDAKVQTRPGVQMASVLKWATAQLPVENKEERDLPSWVCALVRVTWALIRLAIKIAVRAPQRLPFSAEARSKSLFRAAARKFKTSRTLPILSVSLDALGETAP